jgi:hypothetical protein
MRLDHVSYVASHDQISDVVNRIGSQIGTAFVDGGIHPKFGTRNFTAPLLNGQYIEIVCPLDHPATDATPFGQAVKKKADAGGGWLTWVFSLEDLGEIEKKFGRTAARGDRTKPDGDKIEWKQIGVSEINKQRDLPFFIKWLKGTHPSLDGSPTAKMIQINISGKDSLNKSRLKNEILNSMGSVRLQFTDSQDELGISRIDFEYNNRIVEIS